MVQLPDNTGLFNHLAPLLHDTGGLAEIISREKFPEQGTYPIEIVECRMNDDSRITLFCKFLAGGGPNNNGHRGGVAYEAKIYADIISKITLPHIKYYGTCEIPENNELIVVLEYIGKFLRFGYSTDKLGLQKAAAWIGTFHSQFESAIQTNVKRYDREYYDYWFNRFQQLVSPIIVEYPIIELLIRHYSENCNILIDGDFTLIHGEYYPRNILIKEGIIYPVDWESVALAPGEMDFACLIEHWDKASIESATNAYLQARWPDGNFSRQLFEERLTLSKIHYFFRWCPFKLGTSDWIKNKKMYNYLVELCDEAADRFGNQVATTASPAELLSNL